MGGTPRQNPQKQNYRDKPGRDSNKDQFPLTVYPNINRDDNDYKNIYIGERHAAYPMWKHQELSTFNQIGTFSTYFLLIVRFLFLDAKKTFSLFSWNSFQDSSCSLAWVLTWWNTCRLSNVETPRVLYFEPNRYVFYVFFADGQLFVSWFEKNILSFSRQQLHARLFTYHLILATRQNYSEKEFIPAGFSFMFVKMYASKRFQDRYMYLDVLFTDVILLSFVFVEVRISQFQFRVTPWVFC